MLERPLSRWDIFTRERLSSWALSNKFRLKLYLKKYMENSSFWYFSFLYYYPYKDFSYMNKHWHTNFHISFLFLAFIKFFAITASSWKKCRPLSYSPPWERPSWKKICWIINMGVLEAEILLSCKNKILITLFLNLKGIMSAVKKSFHRKKSLKQKFWYFWC